MACLDTLRYIYCNFIVRLSDITRLPQYNHSTANIQYYSKTVDMITFIQQFDKQDIIIK